MGHRSLRAPSLDCGEASIAFRGLCDGGCATRGERVTQLRNDASHG